MYVTPLSTDAWNVIVVPVNAAGNWIAKGIRAPSIDIAVDVVAPLAITTSTDVLFLAKIHPL